MSAAELQQEFAITKNDLFKVRFEVKTGASKASNKLRELKKYIAQIRTVQTQLEIADKNSFASQKIIETPKLEKDVA
ncbi:50S ribosomal protein L29 [Patescibacteria group bacterium]|nr:50S ribosomal protein L29 [Patescibacteria group bacterium]